jgi:ubiquinone biosynthesis protein UbiJ
VDAASPLRETGLRLLERTLNGVLAMDDETPKRLAPLHGKLIEIRTRAPALHFCVEGTADGLRLHPAPPRPADTVISGATIALARQRLSDDPRRALLSGEVNISGDLQAGAAFRALLDGLDIDWEEQASRLFGDVLAHQFGNAVRGLRSWAGDSADALRHGCGEYLREESRLLADRHDTEAFMNAVDALRADADRLQQRIERLHAALRARDGGEPRRPPA